jgi:hypothetical protein
MDEGKIIAEHSLEAPRANEFLRGDLVGSRYGMLYRVALTVDGTLICLLSVVLNRGRPSLLPRVLIPSGQWSNIFLDVLVDGARHGPCGVTGQTVGDLSFVLTAYHAKALMLKVDMGSHIEATLMPPT